MKYLKVTLFVCLFIVSNSLRAEDSRQKVEFPQMMKNHMMANMRDHLSAINDIQLFISTAEYEKAADVAEQRLGLSSLDDHGATHMAQVMPEGMQKIGTNMHKAASQFAITIVDVGIDGDLKPAFGALSKITQQCVACHSAYRVH